jgi:glycine betaine catabolism B
MDASYFRTLVILNGAIPALVLVFDALRGQLGANGVNNALHITGILSLVFLFLSLAVTPLRAVTGWNWLIAGRRWLGLYGFAYAMVHLAIYVVWDRMGSIIGTLEEIASRRFLTVGAVAVLLMIPLAITSTDAMIRRLGAARWKLLHRLAYVVTILGVLHYYMLVKSDVRQPLAFALVLTPLLGFRVAKHYVDARGKAARTGPGRPEVPSAAQSVPHGQPTSKLFRGELVVANVHQETPDVKTFRLVNPHGGDIPFRHQPGQFMTVHLKTDGAEVRRSYTIASAPSQRGHVELTIKRHPQGRASTYLHQHVRVGQRIQVSAPAGRFWFDGSTSDRVLLIAGGVGITPAMSMLRFLTDTGWGGEIVFLHAARTEQDMIFAGELASLVHRHARLVLVTFLSRAERTESRDQLPVAGSVGERAAIVRRGYVSAEAIEEFVAEPAATPVYLCGPEPMMAATRALLNRLGVSDSLIHTEKFVSPAKLGNNGHSADVHEAVAGEDVPIPSQLAFSRSNKTIQIDPSHTILEAAESHDVRIESECRSGICGQCKVRCLSGRVVMAAADALSAAERRNGWILACQARAATASVEVDA